jgi:hypothetical protein
MCGAISSSRGSHALGGLVHDLGDLLRHEKLAEALGVEFE